MIASLATLTPSSDRPPSGAPHIEALATPAASSPSATGTPTSEPYSVQEPS